MRMLFTLALAVLLVSCSASEEFDEGGDPLSGTWVGDFGPAFYDRNTISLELSWDGKELTGMIKPGVQGGSMYRNFAGFPIEKATFDPATGAIRFEAVYKPKARHYIIEGRLKKGTFSGKWNRPEDNREGDFKLKRKPAS